MMSCLVLSGFGAIVNIAYKQIFGYINRIVKAPFICLVRYFKRQNSIDDYRPAGFHDKKLKI
jgi:transposase